MKNISNLEKVNYLAVRDFKIVAIPVNYLLDRNGRIIAKNVWGKELEKILEGINVDLQ